MLRVSSWNLSCSRSAIRSWWAGGSIPTRRRECALEPWLNTAGHLYHTTLPRRPAKPPWETVKESMGKMRLSPPQCLQDLCTTTVAIYLIHFSKSTLYLHLLKLFFLNIFLQCCLPLTPPLSKHIYKSHRSGTLTHIERDTQLLEWGGLMIHASTPQQSTRRKMC